jgi:hypothetical protein
MYKLLILNSKFPLRTATSRVGVLLLVQRRHRDLEEKEERENLSQKRYFKTRSPTWFVFALAQSFSGQVQFGKNRFFKKKYE